MKTNKPVKVPPEWRVDFLRPECGELLDIRSAARYLNTSERWLRRAWAERRIPAIKLGRLVRFSTRDLDEVIQSGRVERER